MFLSLFRATAQVGIVAINIMGSAVPSAAGVPALDDMSMDMQLDTVTASQIRQLHAAKVKAVQGMFVGIVGVV